MNKQKHLNLVHVRLDMSTHNQKTVNSEAEKEFNPFRNPFGIFMVVFGIGVIGILLGSSII